MSYTKVFIKGEVRIYVTDATGIAQEAINRHKTKPLAALALSTAISAFALFATLHKEGRTSVNLSGNGPLGTLLVETNTEGHIRALVGKPNVVTEFDETRFNDIPLTLGIGDGGTLKVTREVLGNNFGGEVPLANGDVVTDLAYYFDQSEQVNTAVVSDVRLKTPTKLERGYSVFFQMLPDHSEVDVKWVEDFIKNNPLSKHTLDEYIEKMDAKPIDHKLIKWQCTCSLEKMKQLVKVIPEEERDEIIKKHGHIEVECNYCHIKYTFK